MHRTAWAAFVFASIALGGCPHTPAPNDGAGPDGSAYDGVVNEASQRDQGVVPYDSALMPDSEFFPWDGGVPLFGACSTTDQCVYSVGATCLTTYPGGLCTHRCDRSTDCRGGACFDNVCLPACDSADNNCVSIGGMCAYGQWCAPSCGVGAAPCPSGTVCDPYSVECTATPLTSGATNGAPCTSDNDCLGYCVPEGFNADGSINGYVDGMCLSSARMLDASAFVPGAPLPTSNCPPGNVIVPGVGSPGEMTACVPLCHGDGDCRPGYACVTSDGTNTYADGYCAPINCLDSIHSCPTGYTCMMSAAGGGNCGH